MYCFECGHLRTAEHNYFNKEFLLLWCQLISYTTAKAFLSMCVLQTPESRDSCTDQKSNACYSKRRFTHSMPFPCCTHAVPLPCRAAKGLECVFPIWFTQCGPVWFTLTMPCPCHAPTMPFPCHATAQHGRRETAVLCCGLGKNGMVGAWHGHGMASVNQTRPHCVNKMGKTHYKPLAARHGRGMAWARHGHGMLCVNRPLTYPFAVSCRWTGAIDPDRHTATSPFLDLGTT